jgi:hypothetical protein
MHRQDLASQQVADVKILQKVNAHHRDAFAVKYPGQVEHCLRLVMERLQTGLDKRDGVDIANPDTWRLSTQELSDLVQCAFHLDLIRKGFAGDPE